MIELGHQMARDLAEVDIETAAATVGKDHSLLQLMEELREYQLQGLHREHQEELLDWEVEAAGTISSAGQCQRGQLVLQHFPNRD